MSTTIEQIKATADRLRDEFQTAVSIYADVYSHESNPAFDTSDFLVVVLGKANGSKQPTIEAAEASMREELSESRMLQKAAKLRAEADALEQSAKALPRMVCAE